MSVSRKKGARGNVVEFPGVVSLLEIVLRLPARWRGAAVTLTVPASLLRGNREGDTVKFTHEGYSYTGEILSIRPLRPDKHNGSKTP